MITRTSITWHMRKRWITGSLSSQSLGTRLGGTYDVYTPVEGLRLLKQVQNILWDLPTTWRTYYYPRALLIKLGFVGIHRMRCTLQLGSTRQMQFLSASLRIPCMMSFSTYSLEEYQSLNSLWAVTLSKQACMFLQNICGSEFCAIHGLPIYLHFAQFIGGNPKISHTKLICKFCAG